MSDPSVFLIALLAFTAVTGFVFVSGQYLLRELRIKQRSTAPARQQGQNSQSQVIDGLNAVVLKFFDEKRFKVEGSVRTKLRQELLRAGFFHVNAINYYILWRIV